MSERNPIPPCLSHLEQMLPAWRSDMGQAYHRTGYHTRPVLVGKRGSPLMAMAVWSGQKWRHADSLEPVCFEPDVWQPLPKAARALIDKPTYPVVTCHVCQASGTNHCGHTTCPLPRMKD